jgi:hypothetical protein
MGFTTNSSRSALTFMCLALAMAAGSTLAAPPEVAPRDCNPATDDPLHGGLPFFDVRSDKNEMPTPAVRAAIDGARAKGGVARSVEMDALLGRVPLLKIDSHQYYGTPFYIRSTMAYLTNAAPGADAKAVAQSFVAANPALFEVDATELAKARMMRDFTTEHNGVRHLTFQQQINGVDLFECNVFGNVMADGRLINIGSTMLPRPAGDFAVAQPRLTDLDAVRFAASSAGVLYTQIVTPKNDPEGPTLMRTWNNTSDFRADEPIVTQLIYFAVTRDDIRTAWSVLIPVKGVGHTYDVIIDASTGELLRRQDRLVWDLTPMTFRVFPSDGVAPLSPSLATPTGFQAPEIARTLLTVNPADISAMDPDGWIATGLNETQGNNVDAHLDLDANNSPDLPRPNGGASRTFDFSFNSTLAPTSWRDFAVTELFWRGNWYHDRLYELGFTEAAGNFQVSNFGRGGTGNDAVQADAQDGSGTNNANFGTGGADGSSARCQMYIFTGPTPDRDGDLDGDIVYHEFTHGTSTRLHHGLSGTQSGGMGEGWSDYYAISLLAESTDDPDANYCTGGYTTLQLGSGFVNNYYFGIRRFPYSHNLNVYPLTYADIAVLSYDTSIPANPLFIGNSASEVHNVGEIWCNMLLDCRGYLMHTYGFAGNQRMLQLVTDSMSLAPPGTPNFIQERDAILQADMTDYGTPPNPGPDANTIWTAFARHGLGFSATSGNPPNNGIGVVEAYDLPQYVTFTYPDGVPTQLAPSVPTTFRVNMAPTDLTITPGTATLHYTINGGSDNTAPLASIGTNQFTATIPGQACYGTVRFYIAVGTSAGNRTDPSNAPTSMYLSSVFTTTYVDESFETANPAWTAVITRTAGTTALLTGLWERAIPTGNAATTPQTAHDGQFCWVTQNGTSGEGAGATDVDNGTTVLTSPAFNLSAAPTSTVVSYWRWFSNNGGGNPNTQTFLIDVSVDNGASWTRAETIGPTTQNTGGWLQGTWTFASVGLTPSSQVKLRFTVADLIGAVVEAALDDLVIYSCTPPTNSCDSADFNCDGDVGTDADIEAFFACVAGSCPVAPCTNSADFNHDGDIGTDADIEAFFRVLGGGPC